MTNSERWRGIIQEFREFLPVSEKTSIFTIEEHPEGNTPLKKAERFCQTLGLDLELYFKLECDNPTGSFKDRGVVLAIAKAVENGAKAVIVASTGNLGHSTAFYAARAGLKAFILFPKEGSSSGKIIPILLSGAKIVQINADFGTCLKLVRQITKQDPGIMPINSSLNQYRLAGQKTAAIEICRQLGFTPHYHFIPVGNGGNIAANWQGYKDYFQYIINKSGNILLCYNFLPPKMFGFQAEGAAPIVFGRKIKEPKTIASAICIGSATQGVLAKKAARESFGALDIVSDQEILEAYRLLVETEQIFVEPAAAVSVAGLLKYYRRGKIEKGKIAVCTLTGHGLKDLGVASELASEIISLEPDADKLSKVLEAE